MYRNPLGELYLLDSSGQDVSKEVFDMESISSLRPQFSCWNDCFLTSNGVDSIVLVGRLAIDNSLFFSISFSLSNIVKIESSFHAILNVPSFLPTFT